MGEPDQWSWDSVNQPPDVPGQPPQSPGATTDRTPPGNVQAAAPIIPLRPLGFGEFFDGSFRAIQHNPRIMFGLSLLVALVLGILEALLYGSALGQVLATDTGTIPAGPLGTVMAGSVVAGIASMFATIVLNGLLVTSVSQSILGRRVTVAAVWQQARGLLWRLIGLSLLIGAIPTVLIAGTVTVLVFLGIAAASAGSDWGWLLLTLALLVILGAVLLAGFLYVKLAIASPVLMMERTGVLEAFRRSWNLTAGFFWRNLGVLVVASAVAGALAGVASMPISILSSGLVSLGTEFVVVASIASVLLAALLNAIVTPFLAAITSLLYVDLRMRKEGLDVQLVRTVGTAF